MCLHGYILWLLLLLLLDLLRKLLGRCSCGRPWGGLLRYLLLLLPRGSYCCCRRCLRCGRSDGIRQR
jgi:hypothetical protein